MAGKDVARARRGPDEALLPLAAAVEAGTGTVALSGTPRSDRDRSRPTRPRSGLDAEVGGTTPGTRVITWPCQQGASNQWWYTAFDSYGRETLRSATSGLCVDFPGQK
ncbi:RICIN domain-containing protein [Streptomyces goshikiensis]|uniref:RICIN domain-containing protein n=1 Tax=Streptomyces goshikiensis TaxID=1942 RepID=UPI003695E6D8